MRIINTSELTICRQARTTVKSAIYLLGSVPARFCAGQAACVIDDFFLRLVVLTFGIKRGLTSAEHSQACSRNF